MQQQGNPFNAPVCVSTGICPVWGPNLNAFTGTSSEYLRRGQIHTSRSSSQGQGHRSEKGQTNTTK